MSDEELSDILNDTAYSPHVNERTITVVGVPPRLENDWRPVDPSPAADDEESDDDADDGADRESLEGDPNVTNMISSPASRAKLSRFGSSPFSVPEWWRRRWRVARSDVKAPKEAPKEAPKNAGAALNAMFSVAMKERQKAWRAAASDGGRGIVNYWIGAKNYGAAELKRAYAATSQARKKAEKVAVGNHAVEVNAILKAAWTQWEEAAEKARATGAKGVNVATEVKSLQQEIQAVQERLSKLKDDDKADRLTFIERQKELAALLLQSKEEATRLQDAFNVALARARGAEATAGEWMVAVQAEIDALKEPSVSAEKAANEAKKVAEDVTAAAAEAVAAAEAKARSAVAAAEAKARDEVAALRAEHVRTSAATAAAHETERGEHADALETERAQHVRTSAATASAAAAARVKDRAKIFKNLETDKIVVVLNGDITVEDGKDVDVAIQNMQPGFTAIAEKFGSKTVLVVKDDNQSGGGIRGTIMTGGDKKIKFKASFAFDKDSSDEASNFVAKVKKEPVELFKDIGKIEIKPNGVKINYPNSDDDEKDLVNKQNKIENLEDKIKVLQKELRNNKVASSNDDFLVVVQIDENFRKRFAESKKYMTLQIPPEKEGDEPTLFNIEKPKTIPSNEYLLIKPPSKADKEREALRKEYEDQIDELGEKLAIAEKAAQKGINLCKIVKGQAGMKDVFGKLPVVGSMLFPEGTPEEREKRKEEKLAKKEKRKEEKLAKKRQKIKEDLAFNEEIKETKRQNKDAQLKYELQRKADKRDSKIESVRLAREEQDAKLDTKQKRNIELRKQKQSENVDKTARDVQLGEQKTERSIQLGRQKTERSIQLGEQKTERNIQLGQQKNERFIDKTARDVQLGQQKQDELRTKDELSKASKKFERSIRLREQKQSELEDKNEALSQKRQDITSDKEVQNQAKTRKKMENLDQRNETLKRKKEERDSKKEDRKQNKQSKREDKRLQADIREKAAATKISEKKQKEEVRKQKEQERRAERDASSTRRSAIRKDKREDRAQKAEARKQREEQARLDAKNKADIKKQEAETKAKIEAEENINTES